MRKLRTDGISVSAENGSVYVGEIMTHSIRDKHGRRRRKFEHQKGLCHWCKKPMTLEGAVSGRKPPRNYATFEHLQRRRDGGAGKPGNIVLACSYCNNKREHGLQVSKPKPENVAAWKARSAELVDKLKRGELTPQERAQMFKRGILPNWPMWSSMMAHVPLGNP